MHQRINASLLSALMVGKAISVAKVSAVVIIYSKRSPAGADGEALFYSPYKRRPAVAAKIKPRRIGGLFPVR